jgi:thioredoxin-related protein
MYRLKSSKLVFIFLFVAGISSFSFIPECSAQQSGSNQEIYWMNFDEAVKLNQQHPKKIFIDVYTPWCGWCKKMDGDTYQDPAIVNYLNKNFYAVHLDAETGDTFHFKDHIFYNVKPHTRGYVNELASSLLDGKLGYPTTIYMDESFARLTYVQSYISAADLMPILRYFAENKYLTMNFDDFKKSDKGSTGNSSGK